MKTLQFRNGQWELKIRLEGCMKVYRGKKVSYIMKTYIKEVPND